MRSIRLAFHTALVAICFHASAYAQNDVDDYLTIPLEELTNLKVTSVSKKAENVKDAAAAVYVITQEDIRRSGMASIPELLRMVPGMQVVRVDASRWRISARGFNDAFANKLLVMIDGRSIYTPLFSGVYWDEQDMMLEDVERIEVIRGPGATLWGANAVNGVINIISKSAKDTQGKLVSGIYGNEERGNAAVRYGGKINKNTHYRAYAKYFNRAETDDLAGAGLNNGWDASRIGFRWDWDKSIRESISIMSEAYSGGKSGTLLLPSLSAPFTTPTAFDENRYGGHVLGRWNYQEASGAENTLQLYFDTASREHPTLDQSNTTLDADFQRVQPMGKWNELIWGAGYRYITDDLDGTLYTGFSPTQRSYNLVSAFIQDKITLVPQSLFLTLGSKFEHNDFSGFEYQPSARLAWTVDDKQTLWTSASRAIRSPSRAEENMTSIVVGNLKPGFVQWVGDEDYESEVLIAYEIGYRFQPTYRLSFDVAAFHNDYSNLRTFETQAFVLSTDPLPVHPVVRMPVANMGAGETNGIELSSEWEVTKNWKLVGNYSFLTMDIHLKPGSQDILLEGDEGKSPKNQVALLSYLNLPYHMEWDAGLYYTDNVPFAKLEPYFRLDTRLGWNPLAGLNVSLVGQNLLDDNHQEFTGPLQGAASQLGRTYYVAATYRF